MRKPPLRRPKQTEVRHPAKGNGAPESAPPNIASKNGVADFASELKAIHSENLQYWQHGDAATPEARAEYQQNKQRVEEIRAALAEISSRKKTKETKL
jgi:hypothetical protein